MNSIEDLVSGDCFKNLPESDVGPHLPQVDAWPSPGRPSPRASVVLPAPVPGAKRCSLVSGTGLLSPRSLPTTALPPAAAVLSGSPLGTKGSGRPLTALLGTQDILGEQGLKRPKCQLTSKPHARNPNPGPGPSLAPLATHPVAKGALRSSLQKPLSTPNPENLSVSPQPHLPGPPAWAPTWEVRPRPPTRPAPRWLQASSRSPRPTAPWSHLAGWGCRVLGLCDP